MEPVVFPTSRDGSARMLAVALGIGMGVGAAVCALRATGALEPAELRIYDVRLRARPGPANGDAPITLIRVREEEIHEHGHPLPDRVLTEVLQRIAAHAPRAIGVDLYRDAAAPEGRAGSREALARVVADRPGIVFIEKLPEPGEPGVSAPPFVDEARVGFSDLPLDGDGAVRRGLLMLWDAEDRPHLSLALQLALRQLAPEGVSLAPAPDRPEWVRLGPTVIPPLEADDGPYAAMDAGGYQVLLDFARGRGAFPAYDLADVLAGRVPAAALRDRIVILGTTAPSVKDDFQTPLAGGSIHGIELHAHAADQLLRFARGASSPLRSWGESAEMAWIIAWSIAGALIALRIRAPHLLVLCAGALFGLLVAGAWLAFRSELWVPIAPPALASFAAGGLVLAEVTRRERAERAAVMDLFGRYVSKSVAEELWSHRAEFMEGSRPRPQQLVITAMLTDLKGYTRAAEKMDPAALMDWVNEYMDAMTRVIEDHGGFVDDYTGDGIKANFGVPIGRDTPSQVAEDARTAVRCALAMGRTLEGLDADWQRRGLPSARMRIGLCTGEAVVGSLGSARRMKYTTVGDTVNTAARIESFRKEAFEAEEADPAAPVFRILVGESTRAHLGDDFEIESLGEHELRGRGARVGIHRVHGERSGGDT